MKFYSPNSTIGRNVGLHAGTKPLKRSRIEAKPYHSINTRKGLIDANDQVTSFIVRKNEPACVICGSTEDLTNGHLFSRRYHATRWDISEDGNCHTQCWNCNLAHVGNRDPYTFWYVNKFGSEAHARLRDRAFSRKHFTDDDLKIMLAEHRLILRGMK